MRFFLIGLGVAVVAAVLGPFWLGYLYDLSHGQELLQLSLQDGIFNSIVMAVIGFAAVLITRHYSFWFLLGWLGSQLDSLTSQEMTRQAAASQALPPPGMVDALAASVPVLAALNWAIIPGLLLGWMAKWIFLPGR